MTKEKSEQTVKKGWKVRKKENEEVEMQTTVKTLKKKKETSTERALGEKKENPITTRSILIEAFKAKSSQLHLI